MSLPPDVSLQLVRFQKAVSDIESEVQKILASATFSPPAQTEPASSTSTATAAAAVLAAATPLERARANLSLAHAIHTLTVLLLKARGLDPSGGKLTQELARLQQYQKKVTKAESEEILRTSRPAASLDIAAANRFITHSIPDLTDDQRLKLRQATAAVRAATDGSTAADSSGAGARGSKRLSAAPAAVQEEQQSTVGTAAAGGKRQKHAGAGGKVPGGVGTTNRDAALQFLDSIHEEARTKALEQQQHDFDFEEEAVAGEGGADAQGQQ